MVVSYEEEKPNLSYVRINQNTSPGTGGAIKGYITKGLVSTDPQVSNAGLLHRSLLGNFTPPPPVETPYWSNSIPKSAAETETSSGRPSQKDVTNSGSNSTVGVAVTVGSELEAGRGRVVPTAERPSHAATQTTFAPKILVTAQAGPIHIKVPSQIPRSLQTASQFTAKITVSTGVKRQLEQPSTPAMNYKVARKSKADIVQENKRLENVNAALLEKNGELQQKLDLLSSILKDPRKRDLLHARLQRLQPSSA